MTAKSWFICKTQVLPLRASLTQPFRTALGSHETLDNLLFVLTLADGTRGYGEAAVAPHITGETLSRTREHLQSAGHWLAGKDARDYLRIIAAMQERYAGNPAMTAAVEMALFDALTRRLNFPLWRLFGPQPVKLQTDITIVIADLPETEASVRQFYAQGFRAFKVKIGRDFDLDLKRVMAVHKLAPKCAIYLDANQGFSAAGMLKFLHALGRKKIRPALLEQPVPRADFEGLKKISRATRIPVCADESVRSIPEAITIIQQKAAAVINIKLMKFGILGALEIVRLARAAGAKLMIGGMMESSLAMTAAAHLAAGSGCFSCVDLDTPFFIREHSNPYLSSRGVYDLSSIRKGIGIIPTFS